MTLFDILAVVVVGLSALSGYNRGAVAELLGLFAVGLSAIVTIALLPATAGIARHVLHAGWLSAAVAALVTFIIVFLFLQILAATLTRSINRTLLGGANRFGGMAFGAVRGVVFLALFALVFNRVTPDERKPHWITGAVSFPLVSKAARVVQDLLPKKFDPVGGFGGQLNRSIQDESSKSEEDDAPAHGLVQPSDDFATPGTPPIRHSHPPSERAKSGDHGYTKHARDSVDALVERSR